MFERFLLYNNEVTFRAQGQTLENICIDLVPGRRNCNVASQYVMLSRATSLSSLYVLRPFSPSDLGASKPEALKTELSRLEVLDAQTETRILDTAERTSDAFKL